MVWLYPIEELDAVVTGERSLNDVMKEHAEVSELLTSLMRECPKAARYLKAAKSLESEDTVWLMSHIRSLLNDPKVPARTRRRICRATR